MKQWLRVHWTKSLLIGVGVAFLLVLADLLIKWAVELNTIENEPIAVIPNFFYITKSYNTAVAFSIGKNWGVGGRVLNIMISIVMSVAIFWYYLTHNDRLKTPERITAVLLGAGAVGNLIDRAFYWEATTGFNGVVDMFQFYLGGGPDKKYSFVNPFATFNFADMCLTFGIIMLLVLMIVDMIKTRDRTMTQDPRLQEKPAPVVKEPSKEEPAEETVTETEETPKA